MGLAELLFMIVQLYRIALPIVLSNAWMALVEQLLKIALLCNVQVDSYSARAKVLV